MIVALASAALAAAVSTWALARMAPRLGLVDGPALGAIPARKLQVRPVPVVGGCALVLGLALGALAAPGASPGLFGAGSVALWAGLSAAFLAGLADDLREGGLGPLAKLGLQLAASTPFALAGLEHGAIAAALLLAGGVAAQNAINTFDNADGGAASLGAAALVGPLPAGACALLGFLPFNLRGARRRGATPASYLGDSGSHLLGMLLLAHPLAWPAFWLPLVDLGRVALERARTGQPPWRGDRRHHAHRLERSGLGPLGVAGAQLAIAAPVLALGAVGIARGAPATVAAGAAASLALYVAALVRTSGSAGPRGARRAAR